MQKPEHDDKHLKFILSKFQDIHAVDFENERSLNSAPENSPFLPSSRLSHKYDSDTGTSRTVHKPDITENDSLKV